jgi:sarcosine oxidase subunit beta
MSAARSKGARLMQECTMTGVTLAGGKVTGVHTSQGDFAAPIIVNAAGAWAGAVNQMVGLDVPYDTWRHDTMFVARPPQIGPSHPSVIDFANDMYFRPERNLTLVGLEDGNPLGESPDNDTDHARKGFVERGIDRICRRIPIMENGGLHSAHGGYDGITPDQHPLLGAAGPDGFYLDCGFSGTGFKTSPAVGLCMAELILDGKATTVDLSIYTPSRFAEGRPIAGEHPYTGGVWH